ncbi:MAG: hypothetical protein WCK15_17575 [Pirellula sp.]
MNSLVGAPARDALNSAGWKSAGASIVAAPSDVGLADRSSLPILPSVEIHS